MPLLQAKEFGLPHSRLYYEAMPSISSQDQGATVDFYTPVLIVSAAPGAYADSGAYGSEDYCCTIRRQSPRDRLGHGLRFGRSESTGPDTILDRRPRQGGDSK